MTAGASVFSGGGDCCGSAVAAGVGFTAGLADVPGAAVPGGGVVGACALGDCTQTTHANIHTATAARFILRTILAQRGRQSPKANIKPLIEGEMYGFGTSGTLLLLFDY